MQIEVVFNSCLYVHWISPPIRYLFMDGQRRESHCSTDITSMLMGRSQPL